MKTLGVEQFDKGRVAKKVMTDFVKMDLNELDKETQGNFTKVFEGLNKVIQKWTGKGVNTAFKAQTPRLYTKPTKGQSTALLGGG